MEDKVIARRLFFSCERSCLNPMMYMILNDGNYVSDFLAESEEEAKAIFKGFIWGMTYERTRKDK